VRWQPGPFDLSALYARGTISDTEQLNLTFVGNPYPVPKSFWGSYVQGAWRVWDNGQSSLAPFVRYEAFNAAGYTAVVFREATENYARQHSANDTLDGVDFDYLAQNVRLNAAAIASLAAAPPAPVVVTERGAPTIARGASGYDAVLTWKASPGAVGYRIYWRDAWAPDWQHQQAVGNVTEFTLPSLSIDNVVIGVAAVGATGHESLVSAYVATARPFAPLQFAQ